MLLSSQAAAALEVKGRELALMASRAAALRAEVARLQPLESLTGDLQRECSRLHDSSDMCELARRVWHGSSEPQI